MTLFIVFAVALVAATIWLVAWPLRRSAFPAQEGHTQLLQLRDRLVAQLNELDIETGDRNVDAAVAADEHLRLEAELARTLKELEQLGDEAGAVAKPSPKLWPVTLLFLAFALPLLGGGLYLATQGPTLLQLSSSNVRGAAEGQVPPMVMEMVGRLEQRLQEQPDDAEGWARLARAYQVLEREDEAQQAYARAYRLAPENPEIIAAYAGFLMSANPAQPTPEAVGLFRKLLAVDAHHPGALWVLGLNAYHEGKYREAVGYWERLLKELPPQSEVEPQVRRALEAARAEMGQKR